jgi:glucose/arabinose dehydrogenase
MTRHPAPRSAWPRAGRWRAALAVLAAGAALTSRAAAVGLPPGFQVVNAAGSESFNMPTALAFTPDGRILVAEKRGVVRVVQNGVKLAQPMWNGEREVLSNGDRGLLGIAIDPDFAVNRAVYLLYSVDPDSNGVDDDDDAFGRLVRYRVGSDPNLLDPTSRTVLLGTTWRDGFPSGSLSHAIGALRWGQDGSLLISCGDGAQYSEVDSGGLDPGLFQSGRVDPSQDLGAFRAQSLASPNGKILRIDRQTGAGLPDNPYFDGDARSARSRVWATGLRNPFRFCVRPGTGPSSAAEADPGVLLVGDVGWMNEEEVNVIRGGENFGWPCDEGMSGVEAYRSVRSVSSGCLEPASDQRAAPLIAYHQVDTSRSTIPGMRGRCVIGGVFHEGASYPSPYRGRYFFADFNAGWIKAAALDESHQLLGVVDFATDAEGPVDFGVDPVGGDLHYLALFTGRLYRIDYQGALAVGPRPRGFSLSMGWPNPSQGVLNLDLEIERAAQVGFSIFDAQGRLVWTDPPRPRMAGRVTFAWSAAEHGGRPAPNGVYFVRVSIDEMTATRRVVVAR